MTLPITFVTGSPADWGLIEAIMSPMIGNRPLTLVVLGDHATEYDGIQSVNVVRFSTSNDGMLDLFAQVAAHARRYYEDDRAPYPDSKDVVVLGDRIEIVAWCVAARKARCRIHHLFAGDRSGCADDYYRDAITMLSDYTYAVSHQAAGRLDVLRSGADDRMHKAVICVQDIGIDDSMLPDEPYAVARFHPETSVDEPVRGWVQEVVMRALKDRVKLYFLPPNGDEGWQEIANEISTWADLYPQSVKLIGSMMRSQYLGLLAHAQWVAGNSSSFVLEAPLVNKRVILYGHRQYRRAAGVGPYVKSLPTMADAICLNVDKGGVKC